jgi:hypothetical protein
LKVENEQPEKQPMEQPNSRFWLLASGSGSTAGKKLRAASHEPRENSLKKLKNESWKLKMNSQRNSQWNSQTAASGFWPLAQQPEQSLKAFLVGEY